MSWTNEEHRRCDRCGRIARYESGWTWLNLKDASASTQHRCQNCWGQDKCWRDLWRFCSSWRKGILV